MGTALLMFENVKNIPEWLVHDNLQEHYKIFVLQAQPEQCNFTHVNRNRLYFVCVHNRNAHVLADVNKVYEFMIQRLQRSFSGPRRPEPRDAIMATTKELMQVERDRAHYLKVRPRCRTGQAFDWTYLLTDSERDNLLEYEFLWQTQMHMDPSCDPNAVFYLGDNPLNRVTWSANMRIPAFRTAGGRMWYPFYRRYLTDNEMMAVLGFPVYPWLANAAKTEILVINSQAAKHLAGNAWHCANAGVAMLAALCSVQCLY